MNDDCRIVFGKGLSTLRGVRFFYALAKGKLGEDFDNSGFLLLLVEDLEF